MQRFFDVEDKLQDPKTEFDIAYTVSDGEATSSLNNDVQFQRRNKWRFEGKVIRRNLQIGQIQKKDDGLESVVTYCVDNTPVKAFDKDGKLVKKAGLTLPHEATVKKFPDNKWYVVNYENKLAPC